jgi:hypothetical protein
MQSDACASVASGAILFPLNGSAFSEEKKLSIAAPPQQVVCRDHLVEGKLVKQLPLISVLPPHHRRLSCRLLNRNHCSLRSSTPFSTASVKLGSGGRYFCFAPMNGHCAAETPFSERATRRQ